MQKVTIYDIVKKVANTTHLESSIAHEAVLAAIGGMRYASVGKREKIVAEVGSNGVELKDAYDNEDLTKNVIAGSPVNIEQARRVVSCVGLTISEHLANVKEVDVEDLGTFEKAEGVVFFTPSIYSKS